MGLCTSKKEIIYKQVIVKNLIQQQKNPIPPSNISCPQKHKNYTFFTETKFCMGCTKQKTGGKICKICNYTVCRQCESLKHNYFCQQNKYLICKSVRLCLYCGRRNVLGKKCKNCEFQICSSCKKIKHIDFCLEQLKSYYQTQKLCLGCGATSKGGIQCTTCRFNICLKCR